MAPCCLGASSESLGRIQGYQPWAAPLVAPQMPELRAQQGIGMAEGRQPVRLSRTDLKGHSLSLKGALINYHQGFNPVFKVNVL